MKVKNLACSRGDRIVFSGLDFTVRTGEVAWIRGANGSGKTTLLRTLAGLAQPSTGGIDRYGAAAAWKVFYVGHANALKDDLTVAESLRFLLHLGGDPAGASVIDSALLRFDLGHRRDAPVRILSQGQRRRLALARLPPGGSSSIWLLDEPYEALDAAGSRALDQVLEEHLIHGGIAILSSHIQPRIQATRLIVVPLAVACGPGRTIEADATQISAT